MRTMAGSGELFHCGTLCNWGSIFWSQCTDCPDVRSTMFVANCGRELYTLRQVVISLWLLGHSYGFRAFVVNECKWPWKPMQDSSIPQGRSCLRLVCSGLKLIHCKYLGCCCCRIHLTPPPPPFPLMHPHPTSLFSLENIVFLWHIYLELLRWPVYNITEWTDVGLFNCLQNDKMCKGQRQSDRSCRAVDCMPQCKLTYIVIY